MAIDFFESELRKTTERFSTIYQGKEVYGKDFRCRLILAIIGLGVLQKKIKAHKRKEDITRFISGKEKVLAALALAEAAFSKNKPPDLQGGFFLPPKTMEVIEHVEHTDSRGVGRIARALRNRRHTG